MYAEGICLGFLIAEIFGGVTLERKQAERGRPKKERRPARQRRKKNKKVRRTITTILLILVITAGMMLGMAAAYIKNVIIPQAGLNVEDYSADLTTTMYYRDDAINDWVQMQELHGEENRVWVTIDQIPKNLQNAAIAIEDKRFLKHHGVDSEGYLEYVYWAGYRRRLHLDPAADQEHDQRRRGYGQAEDHGDFPGTGNGEKV